MTDSFHDPSHVLVSPRGDRTGEVLGLDVALQVELGPVLVALRDQCLRRGPVGFLNLCDKSGVKAEEPPVYMEPERYINLLRDDGHRIPKAAGSALAQAFSDARGYLHLTKFAQRIFSPIFHGERRTRAETVFAILTELSDASSSSNSKNAANSALARFGAVASVPLSKKTIVLRRNGAAGSSWDDCIPSESRRYSLFTFCALMAGVSVVVDSDEEFDAVLRSFEPVVVPAQSFGHAAGAGSTSSGAGAAGSSTSAMTSAAVDEYLNASPERKQQPKTRPKKHQHDDDEGAAAKRYIPGVMVHLGGGASESFGKTFYSTLRELPQDFAHPARAAKAEEEQHRKQQQQKMAISYRGGNKSNFHNFALS